MPAENSIRIVPPVARESSIESLTWLTPELNDAMAADAIGETTTFGGAEASKHEAPQNACTAAASGSHAAAMGVRHGRNPAAGGGYVWHLLPARLRVLWRLSRHLPTAAPLPAPQLLGWLHSEIRILQRSCHLTEHVRRACALADDPVSLRQSLAILEARVHLAVSETMARDGDELHLPILHASPWQDGQAHCTFLGLRRLTLDGEEILRLRVDDSDIDDPTASTELPPPADGRRTKTRPWVAMLEIRRLRSPSLAAAWAEILSLTQPSHADFLARLAHVVARARTQRPEMAAAAEGLRPMSVQAGDTCVLKNHARGCASRLQESIAATEGISLSAAALRSAQAWHWFRAAERQLVLNP